MDYAVYNILLMSLVTLGNADVYMHNPRGSNNRLDERGRERANANRLFDSQNNNRGGYNVGSLYYYEGSELPIEWTAQHSCGEKNADCQLIVQYMCSNQLRDGVVTTTIPEKLQQCANYDCNSDLEFGMNEDFEWYMTCKYTYRNKGLFTADQNLNGDTAKYTRQNPNGNRRGYECPEERDYYPYWRPTPWRDIAIMTNDISRCPELQAESQNVKEKWSCVPPPGYLRALYTADKAALPNQFRKNLPLNKEDCEKIKFPVNSNITAQWTNTPAWGIAAPECIASPKSRDNHNGNGPDAFPNMFNWTIPDSLISEHCVLRLRYNISTADYDNTTDASKNKQGNAAATAVDIGQLVGLTEADAAKRGYVFKNNPEVNPLNIAGSNIGEKLQLQLAINTAQYGRTFQDRSHSFAVRKRTDELASATIRNLNVRGKRGNIVQVYPAVEYDFVPNRLEASVGDYVHIQWTGSNTNPTNNDGQGLASSDRNNMVLLTPQKYPEGTPGKAVAENLKNGQWGNNYPEHLNAANLLGFPKESLVDLAVGMPPGQLRGELSELDDDGPYFDLQPKKVTTPGTYHYMCSRNNNFSNRSQKGKIIVKEAKLQVAQIGFSGGVVRIRENDGVWISSAIIEKNIEVVVEEWEEDAGEKFVQENGGTITMRDEYASKFLSVSPYAAFANGKSVTIKMSVDSSEADVYTSQNLRNWRKVENVEIKDGVATFGTAQGGVFVARKDKSNKAGAIAGGVIGAIAAIVIIVIIIVACRKPAVKKWREGIKMGPI